MFISSAYAQAAGATAAPENGLFGFALPIILLVVMYFIMLRPQMKRQKEQKLLLDALQKGDEVMTASGLLGRIVKLGDNYLTLDIASVGDKPVEVLLQRSAVQTVLPKGTLKDQR
ncbi:MAG: preprotein translocase subunit YajC [Burkholderiaceae bacterium]